MAGRNKFVLVVDDEHMVHGTIEMQLERAGYDKISLDDPDEAVRYFKKNHAYIDSVIIDLTLPGISGIELAEEFLKMKTDLPMILITGASPESILGDKRGLFHHIILKPFTRSEIIEAVESAVGKPRMTA